MRSSPELSLQPPAEPRLLAERYEVERPLGRGGAAQVLAVRDRASGAQLALKLLHEGASRRTAALFELEYRTLAAVEHPCVVRALDFGRAASGASFYTMELLAGEDLKERAPMPWPEACAALRDAARALALLHARRLVHRDVSPRNLFRTHVGRVKLIDFGSLAPFGRSDHVVGTPPYLAPEALWGQELDQRTDLYALGGVAYYLLTRTQAYPALELRALPDLWRAPPAPPSERASALARRDLPPLPPLLDALVLALLSPSALERPSSAAEVVERIDALIGREEDDARAQRELVGAHLASTAYVGQARVVRTLRRQLALAHAGRGRITLVEGEPGSGRSRCLRELGIAARVTEGAVLHVRAAGRERAHDVALALALQLVRVLPEAALAAARPLVGTLAALSPALAAALGGAPEATLAPPADLRARLQRALCDWFLALARGHTLVVLVDDLAQADEGSQAFLLALAEACAHHRLLLVCSASSERREATPAERALRARARTVTLEPLDDDATRALLGSIFGAAAHLPRLSARLWRASGGNPGHLLELCAQMLDDDVIRYADGGWVLPQEPPRALLSASRVQMARERAARLEPPVRALARVLSVHPSPLPLELVQELAEVAGPDAFAALPALIEAGVCAREGSTVLFVHEAARRHLRDALEPALAARCHRHVGAYLLERAVTALEQMQAGVHLLESADARGERVIAQAALHIALHDPDASKPAAPAAERALALLRAAGRPERAQLPVLALLAAAAYAADFRYAAQYGDSAVAAARAAVGLTVADAMRPTLGGKGALLAGLATGALRLRAQRREPQALPHKEAVSLLFGVIASLVATATACLDADAARRHAEALAPFRALGERHIAGFMVDYSVALSELARDRHAHTGPRFRALLARLQDPALTRDVSDSLKKRLAYGAYAALGIIEAQRDGGEALALADRAEQAGLFVTLINAAQIRALHHANQGDLALFEQHCARAEQLAIQQGVSWQAETWAASTRSVIAFRTHDVLMLRQVAEHAERLTVDCPSLARVALRARGAYLVRRARYAEALAPLEDAAAGAPRSFAGWARTHGILAHALNALHEHDRARAVCMRVVEASSPEDLAFGGAELIVQIERLVAEAALHDPRAAQAQLEALLRAQEDHAGPLTLGELHDAGVTIARRAGDREAAAVHVAALTQVYLRTAVPTLVQYAAQRRRELDERAHAPDHALEDRGTHAADLSLDRSLDTVDAVLAGGALSQDERALRALQILAQATGARHGHLFAFDAQGAPTPLASLRDERLAPELADWVRARLAAARIDDEATQLVELAPAAPRDGETLALGARYYRMAMLVHGRPVGCAVLGSDAAVPSWCPGELLRAVARHLSTGATQAHPSRPG